MMVDIILLRPETPENIGFIARSMKNFDLDNLLIIGATCSHEDSQAMRVSMHAKDIIARAKILAYEDFFRLKSEYDMLIGTTSLLGTDYNIRRTPLEPREIAKNIKDSLKENLGL